jgi:hypothetical protein
MFHVKHSSYTGWRWAMSVPQLFAPEELPHERGGPLTSYQSMARDPAWESDSFARLRMLLTDRRIEVKQANEACEREQGEDEGENDTVPSPSFPPPRMAPEVISTSCYKAHGT